VTFSISVTDAAYHTVHDYPGGAPALSSRLGIGSPRVLDNKVNPNSDSHKLTLGEAVKLQAITGDDRILHAMAYTLGFIAVPVCPFEGVSDMALLESYSKMMKEIGEFNAVFHDAFADGKLTRAEVNTMRIKHRDGVRAGEELLNRAESLIDD
jgi:hypothetical protein